MKAFGKTSVLVVAVCMVFAFAGSANANYHNLFVGSPNSPIYVYSNVAGNIGYKSVGAGSFENSYLDTIELDFLYCVDLFKTVDTNQLYDKTMVTNNGTIYGGRVNNAGQVAWLLDTYAYGIDDAHGDAAKALQAAIWNVVYDGNVSLNTSLATATQATLYGDYLRGLAGAKATGETFDNVAAYSWITPGKDSNVGQYGYQGLVGVSTSPVPVPAAAWLLGAGLVGLVGVRRKARK